MVGSVESTALLTVGGVGVWLAELSGEPSSSASDEKLKAPLDLRTGEREGEYVPVDVTDGMVCSFHFLFCLDPLAVSFFSVKECVARFGTEVSCDWDDSSLPSSLSGLKVGRETESEVGRSRSVLRVEFPCGCGLSGSLVVLRVLAFLWWTNLGSDSIDSISLVFIPSLLELVGDVLLEKAESLRLRSMWRTLVRVDGSDPAEGAGEVISSDSPIAESLLE